MKTIDVSNNKIRVVHSHPIWLPQTQTWLYNLVSYLPNCHIESHVVCETTANLDQFATANLHSLAAAPFYRRWVDLICRKLRVRRHLGYLGYVLTTKKAHILHSHFGNAGWVDIGALHRKNIKHVVTFYGLDVNMLPQQEPVWLRRYAQLFSTADLFLCEGPYMAEAIHQLGCPKDKIKVHHLGVEVERIKFEPRKWGKNKVCHILIAGSFREKKGITYALKALKIFSETNYVKITIIGDANNSESGRDEKANIFQTIEDEKLSSQVTLLGYQPYDVLLQEAYKNHIFLSPSVTAKDGDTEGGAPVSIIEMMASGMIVVSSYHCDIPNVITDGCTGLLAEERDVDGLVDKLNWLVSNPESWLHIQENARKHVETYFDTTVQGESLAAIYRELLV